MGNNYFQFKQFRIDQEHCAMKVTTEACILGAWYASKFTQQSATSFQMPADGETLKASHNVEANKASQDVGANKPSQDVEDNKTSLDVGDNKALQNADPIHAKTVLDVGSGTGLLMLMLAQMTDAELHGIELEDDCFSQLTTNITKSLWATRMRIFHGDARDYVFPVAYDFIISNPPFYENELPAETPGKQLAKHSAALNLDALASVIVNNLSNTGSAGILLPVYRSARFEMIAGNLGLFKSEVLKIRQTPKHNWFRDISTYTFKKQATIPSGELTIRDEAGDYSKAFIDLLKPFYLQIPD